MSGARGVAEDGAARAGVTVRDLGPLDEVQRASRLFDDVWGRDPAAGPIVATEVLRAMQHAGCQVSGAFDRDSGEMVGATAALLGREDGALHLHSHVTGVLPAVQGRGIGWALKQYQRAWALERGIEHVRWTYDPLIRRNAVLNLIRLGARPVAYLQDLYGPLADERNRGLPTDRLLVDWALTERRVQLAAAGRPAEVDAGRLRAAGAVEVLRVGADGAPERSPDRGDQLLVQVPGDVESLRAADPAAGTAWSAAVRDALGGALAKGFRVTAFTRDGWYVLARPRVEELAR